MTKWKDIKGFEGLYQVSNDGRVKRLENFNRYLLRNGKPAFRKVPEHEIALNITRNGYVIVHLYKDNLRSAPTVHQLVMEAFGPLKPDANVEIDHIDFDRTNNEVLNLRWVTRSENILHSIPNRKNIKKVRNPSTGIVYPSQTAACRELRMSRKTVVKYFEVIDD